MATTDDSAVNRNKFLVGDAAKNEKCHLCRKPIKQGERAALRFGSINNIYCLRCAK